MSAIALAILENCWFVLGQMAPYLLLGFVVAGVLAAWLPPQWIENHLGRGGFGPILKAALFGVPLPLCSCGVIPVSASIRRHGASRAATTSFLLSTPQTGVDSIAATYAMLGPVFAVFRPVVALLTGLLGGSLVQLFGERDVSTANRDAASAACQEACCADRGIGNPWLRAARYGLLTLPRDVGSALLLGVLIAGAISALMDPGQLHAWLGGGPLAMLAMVVVGIPLYVCATGSVPIAAGFIHLGISPGAAFAFLVSGPATNAATVATIWKVLGRRTAALYLATIVVVAIGGGLALDGLLNWLNSRPPDLVAEEHTMAAMGWTTHVWAAALLTVLAAAYLTTPHDADHAHPETNAAEPADMASTQHIELQIEGMNCSHCVAAVVRALRESPGVTSAEVTLHPGRAVVVGRDLDLARLTAAVKSLGYHVVPHA